MESDYVNLTVNGKNIKVKKGYGMGVPLYDLKYGINNLTLSYAGDSIHQPREINQTINITSPILILNYIGYGSDAECISLRLPEDATGKLVVYVNYNDNEFCSKDLVDGIASISISNLTIGSYSILAVYENGNYDVNNAEDNVFIIPFVNVSKGYDSRIEHEISVKLPESYSGSLSFSISEEFYDEIDGEFYLKEAIYENTTTIINGIGTIKLPILNISGNYYLSVNYVDDNGYTYSNKYHMPLHNVSSAFDLNIEIDDLLLGQSDVESNNDKISVTVSKVKE